MENFQFLQGADHIRKAPNICVPPAEEQRTH